MNGDGFDEVVIGAPDDDTSDPSSHATVEGRLYIFSGTDLVSGSYGEADAVAVVNGASKSDGFGQSLLSVDLDSDGMFELIIGETGAAAKKGRIRIWDPW